MNDSDLERFHDNYLADEEAMPLIQELHAEYGESFLCECLHGDDVRHTLTLVCEIKTELRDRFLISVCSQNHITEKELKLDSLFPNLVHLLTYEAMIRTLEERGWISSFKIMNPFKPEDRFRRVKRTIYAKGYAWVDCPEPIRDHFLGVKAEGNTKT